MRTKDLADLTVKALGHLLALVTTDSQTMRRDHAEEVRVTIRRIQGMAMEPIQPSPEEMAGWANTPGATDKDEADARTGMELLRRILDGATWEIKLTEPPLLVMPGQEIELANDQIELIQELYPE